ncbi:MAG: zinc-dependent peptidase [Comamonadaceae bacterium]|nr:zinc-dependent peptidase [Comamonadaceae bacterium]
MEQGKRPAVEFGSPRLGTTAMWPWLRLGRRRLAIPDALPWSRALTHIPHASGAPPARDRRRRLRELTLAFLRAKVFEAAAGLELTDAMRVHVALQACLLILKLDAGYYDGWRGGDPLSRRFSRTEGTASTMPAWSTSGPRSWPASRGSMGPVILSWDASRGASTRT